jgi:Flp pilus assembly protein TadD
LADCEINLRQFGSALATLSECGPQADRWAREAECLHGLSRLDEARGRVAQTLDHDPAHLTGLLLAGTMAAERNDTAGAVEWFSRAVVAHPKDYTARFRLAQAYRRSGNIAEADEHTRVAEEIKRVREEFSRLHGTAAAEPGNANVRCRLGVLARELGRPDLARTWFRAALAIDPGHAETLRNLAGEPPHKAQK